MYRGDVNFVGRFSLLFVAGCCYLQWNAQVACGATTAVPPKKAMSKLKEALRVAQVTQNTLSRDVQVGVTPSKLSSMLCCWLGSCSL